jgi:hypothetical protein
MIGWQWRMNWNDVEGSERPWLNLMHCPYICLERLRKTINISSRILVIPADVWTGHFLNPNQTFYHLSPPYWFLCFQFTLGRNERKSCLSQFTTHFPTFTCDKLLPSSELKNEIIILCDMLVMEIENCVPAHEHYIMETKRGCGGNHVSLECKKEQHHV